MSDKPILSDILHSFVKINLIKKYNNFKPVVNFIDGLNETISYYQF
jgi:hypothetical protein